MAQLMEQSERLLNKLASKVSTAERARRGSNAAQISHRAFMKSTLQTVEVMHTALKAGSLRSIKSDGTLICDLATAKAENRQLRAALDAVYTASAGANQHSKAAARSEHVRALEGQLRSLSGSYRELQVRTQELEQLFAQAQRDPRFHSLNTLDEQRLAIEAHWPPAGAINRKLAIPFAAQLFIESLASHHGVQERSVSSMTREMQEQRNAFGSSTAAVERTKAQLKHLVAHRNAQAHIVSDLKSQLCHSQRSLAELRAEIEHYKVRASAAEARLQDLEFAVPEHLHSGMESAEPSSSGSAERHSRTSSPASPVEDPMFTGRVSSSLFQKALGRMKNSTRATRDELIRLVRLASQDIARLSAELESYCVRFRHRIAIEEACRESQARSLGRTVSEYEEHVRKLREQIRETPQLDPEPKAVQTDGSVASTEELKFVCGELDKVRASMREQVLQQSKATQILQSKLNTALEKVQLLHLLKDKWRTKYNDLKQRGPEGVPDAALERAAAAAVVLQRQASARSVGSQSTANCGDNNQPHDSSSRGGASDPEREGKSGPTLDEQDITLVLAQFAVAPRMSTAKQDRINRILQDLRQTFLALGPYLVLSQSSRGATSGC
mmetsp:Transcript_22577/g.72254  ORF Transcript_22577/g.72254 Transcript_22577/m.72254 type:complete len:613 (+) Transcript_22577:137-1975(+)